jgi:hypothetical protein
MATVSCARPQEDKTRDHRQGADISALLPVLSTYLGHDLSGIAVRALVWLDQGLAVI